MTRNADSNRFDSLMGRARSLPDALPPSGDLWPDIERELVTPARREWTNGRLAAAAAILVALSCSFTFFLTRMLDAPSAIEATVTPPTERFGPWYAGGTDIVQARAELLHQVRSELTTISPEARQILVENMNKIEAARREINAALDGHPDNELLQHLLLSTYTNELTLLTQIGSMTRSAQQRITL